MLAKAPVLLFGQILSHLVSITYKTSWTPPSSPVLTREECSFQMFLSIHYLQIDLLKCHPFMISSIQTPSSLLTLLQWKKITTFWIKISWNLFAGKHISFCVNMNQLHQSMSWVTSAAHALFSGLGFNMPQRPKEPGLSPINVVNHMLYLDVKVLVI